MPIPLYILQRIKKAVFNEHQIVDALVKAASIADARDISKCELNLEFVHADDCLIPGDLIPTVTFSLQRVEVADSPDVLPFPPPFPPAEAATTVTREDDEDPYPEK